MEVSSANTFVPDDTGSSGTADAGRDSEHPHVPSQTLLLHSMQASISSDEATLAIEREASQTDEVNATFLSPDNIQRYQPLAGHVAESPGPSHDDDVHPVGNVAEPSAGSGSQWRPIYLRRRVLAAFSVTFLSMVACLQVLNVLSARNGAIARGHSRDHYLWTYAPTAFLTLIAALFNRVEYQAKLMAPWERLSKRPATAQKTLLLDYVSPLQPVAIYESLRNKDFAVAATTTISLVVKILIVLSSGLITLSRIAVHHTTIPMEIQNAFVDDASALRTRNYLPYFVMQGLMKGSDYPPGITNEFAYQSVQSNLPGTAQYEVIVDGLATDLRCEVANLDASSAVAIFNSSNMNLTIASRGCDVAKTFQAPGPPFEYSKDGLGQVTFGKFEPVQCDGTSGDAGMRVFVIFGLEEWFMDDTIPPGEVNPDYIWNNICLIGECGSNLRGRLLKSAQLLCAPRYEIAKVSVVQNGTEVQSVTLAGESLNRTLDHVSPWDFMKNFFRTFDYATRSEGYGWRGFIIGQQQLKVDDFMHSLLETQTLPDTNVSMLFDPNFLKSIATKYYRQVGPIIARQLSMEPTSLNTTGSAMIMEDRLVARGWALQWMAGLISLCLILSLLTAFIIPQHGILHQNPNTLPGIGAIVAHSPDLLDRLRYSGDADSKTLHLQLKGSNFQSEVIHQQPEPLFQRYMVIRDVDLASTGNLPWSFHQSESTHAHPWILHPASRLGLGLTLAACVVTLEVILHQSSSHEGLGNVGDSAYIHYTWTSLPSLVFGGIAMMLSSMDFNIRSLAPYTSLSDVVSDDTFRILDFLDMSVPSALFKEAKLRNIGALATTSKLLVASLFTIFSGSLFQGVYFPATDVLLLRNNNSFGSPSHEFDVTPGLISTSNWSYPSFTYEDLAFPQFIPDVALVAKHFSSTPLLSIKAVVPALRSRLQCRMYNSSNIRVRAETIPKNETDVSRMFVRLWYDINEESDGPSKNLTNVDIPANTSYFGLERGFSTYSNNVFFWGKKDPFPNSKVEHIAAMGCNQSIEVVDVETTFIGADLAIDVDNPPRAVSNTERTLTVPLNLTWFDDYSINIPNLPQYESLDDFFTLLTRSRWAIPLSMLGGGSDDAVAAAIKFQYGVFFAQALNKGRVPAAETNVTLTPEQALAGGNDAGQTFEATVFDEAGRQRVVQDAISTRILEALLLVTLILLGVGWVWLPKTNVLPKRSPTTIASAVALLAGGNLTEWLNENDGGTIGERGNTRFWMGWGNVPDEEGILMGNENENGISRFGIFAVKSDDDDDEQMRSLHRTTPGD